MNIEHLHEFIELARTLNYHDAASTLCLSQSALSKHIKALEAEYGVALFYRDKRSVELSPEGAALLEYAQEMWRVYQLSREALTNTQTARPLLISGIIESPDEHRVMSSVISAMNAAGAKRRVQVHNAGNMSASEQFEALAQGAIDCFVSFNLESDHLPVGISVEHLCDIPLCVVVSKTNALTEKQALRPTDLAGATFIHLAGPNFTPTWRLIDHMLTIRGVPHITKPVPTSSIYDYLNLELDNCVLVLPRRGTTAQLRENPHVRLIDIADDTFRLQLDAAFRTNTEDDALSLLLANLRTCYEAVYVPYA